ncbi:MAG: DEAD/DEAH box helicase family protein [Acidobacteriota bacterium]
MVDRDLSEADVCDQFITPAIVSAGWDAATQVRREYSFTAGRVSVRGSSASRGPRKRADYLLSYQPNLPLAIVEAKGPKQPVGGGMEQALAYAESLQVPFVFTSNGTGFVLHDRTGNSSPVEQEIPLADFPSPADLWARYRAHRGLPEEAESLATHPYYDDYSGKEPRYYQRNAVQLAIEAVARDERRILLVMATGTGKTYTAFQVIWRLWKSKRVKRVLFLVDRNILADQTITNDFKPFGQVMTKIRHRMADTSYEVYLALYQAITGTEEDKNIYRQFSPDFFDLVVIDECHRGSARESSAWREVLDHFDSAIHLGLTATPKETRDVSTLTYFGDPIYTYSLRQGIDDGFLAPYKVVRVDIDKDLQGWRPPAGTLDDLGQQVEDRIYNQRDMDRVLVLNQRTKLVAARVVEYMRKTDPYGKAIVFCENIDHASRMRRALINKVAATYPEEGSNVARFVVQITGDNDEGKRALDDFIHPEKRYPVIATTSKLLTTGVDAKTCKLIVLDQGIQSMIEFKQIIGRGTRIHEDTGKLWFTVIDFKKATELFADPDFDGDPEVIIDESSGEGTGGPTTDDGPGPGPDPGDETEEGATRYVISELPVSVVAERVQYLDGHGNLITESLTDYTRKAVNERYATLEDFLKGWESSDRKKAILDELTEQGLFLEELREQVGADYDPFDLICHIVYDQPPLTRRERAEQVRKRDVFTKYGDKARAVLDALLDKYSDQGLLAVEDLAVLKVQPISDLGTPLEIIESFGGKDGYLMALQELETALYQPAA